MSAICIECHQTTVEEVVNNNRRYYFCSSCQKLHERAIDSRYGKDVTIESGGGELTHLSAGALLRNGSNILLIKRRAYPYGYSFPAGHVEYGEKPEEALKREVFEEIGLHVRGFKLIFNEEIKGNKCRYGADNHLWYFYEIDYGNEAPILNSEIEGVGWYSTEEIKHLNLVPVAKFLYDNVINIHERQPST